jgi:signal transduction histidine kinase
VHLPRILRTASFRLAALYALLFGGSVVVLGAVMFWTIRAALDQQLTDRIEAEVTSLQAELRSGGLDQLVATVRERIRAPGRINLDYLVQGPTGERLAGDLPPIGERLGWFEVEPDEERQGDDEAGREQVRVLAVQLGIGAGILAVGEDHGLNDAVEETILNAFGWVLGVMVALGVLGGLVLSHSFLRRVDAITRTAEAIIDGHLARRVPIHGTDDDLDRLAGTLNRMLDRIAALVESLRQVSNDIAHDLRTPLTRLRQRLETTRLSAHFPADYEAAVEAAVAEADAILETFAALLRIAQIEAGIRRSGFRDVDLKAVVETVTEAFAPSAEDEGKALDTAVALEPAIVRGDPELLTQLLANLVENAIRHTPSGTGIRIALAHSPSGVRMVVADNGPGVPAGERDRIFRRLYRLERSRTSPGSGLGLSLVAAIVALHGARVAVEDNAPGLRIVIDFATPEDPRQPAQSMSWGAR